MEDLLAGKAVRLPRFEFATGRRETGSELKLEEDGILLVEGLHCLNPGLLPSGLEEQSFRIYASALTQLNLDNHVRMSTTDNRLLRRVVRDAAYRGYTAEDTLRMWDNVRRGEKWFVFPTRGGPMSCSTPLSSTSGMSSDPARSRSSSRCGTPGCG